MQFSILIFHASMHLWNESWGIPLSSFVTAFFMAFGLEKCVRLMIHLTLGKRKSHTEQDQANREVFLSTRNFHVLNAVCAGALSWWSNHVLFSHKSQLFSLSEWCKRCRIFLRSVAQLTDNLHAPASLQAQRWFYFDWWKAFHTSSCPSLNILSREKLLNEIKSVLCRLVEAYKELLKGIFPNGPEISGWFVALLSLQKSSNKKTKICKTAVNM